MSEMSGLQVNVTQEMNKAIGRLLLQWTRTVQKLLCTGTHTSWVGYIHTAHNKPMTNSKSFYIYIYIYLYLITSNLLKYMNLYSRWQMYRSVIRIALVSCHQN